jgi:N-acetylmuramoyl-L-alanine amidase
VRIVIDPGHGGHDPGAVGPSGYTESAFVLAVCARLASRLEEAGQDVRLTRRADTYPTIGTRAYLANEVGADVFVSVHANAAVSREAEGIEVLHYGSRSGIELAGHLYHALVEAFPRSKRRGLKERPDLGVLRLTRMPAALVVCEFISHPKREAGLRDPEVQDRYADAIAAGLAAWAAERS